MNAVNDRDSPIFFHSNTRLAIPQVIFCLQQSDSGSTVGKLGLELALLLKDCVFQL